MEEYEQAVLISYAWGGESEEIVNQIDLTLQQSGLKIIRDKRDLGYKGSISAFMERIGQGNCVIVVISDKYLRSPNCMFELVEIAEGKQFHDRVFPIVLSDANIYDPVRRLEYVKHWELKRGELAQAMKDVDPANLQGIREDMDQYDRIRDKISGLTSILKDMNTLTPDVHRDSDFREIYAGIEKRMAEALGGLTPKTGESPYMGLRYFDTSDTDLFYGREALTRELLRRIKDECFLAIVGASGSGKSSVARAGLIPAWKHTTMGTVYVMTPTARPLESLAASLTRESESVTATSTLMDDLRRDARSLRLFVRKMLSSAENRNLLLVVDQFEETFTLCKDPHEREAFIENLLSLAEEAERSAAHVVITLRADFYHHCFEYEGLRLTLQKHQENIGTMTQAELRQAILQPAEKNGWDFQPGLVELILQDVGTEPGALPLLSHALLETWKRRQGRTLTFQGYHDAGGVKKAITQTAEGVYDRLSPAEKEIARSIFLRLTELGEGVQDTRRRVKREELVQSIEKQEYVENVLQTLTDARLVMTEQDSAEVAHEALIREWGTLRRWLEENRERLRFHRHLTESAQDWLNSARDELYLIHRGGRLDDALLLLENPLFGLSTMEKEYLDACIALRDREKHKEERRLRWTALVSITVALVILIFGSYAWLKSKEATRQANTSFARQLASQAKLLDPDDETLLIQRKLLSIESMQRYPNLEAQQNLNDIFLSTPVLSTPPIPMQSAVMSPSEQFVAGIDPAKSLIRVWDILKGEEIFNLPYTGEIRNLSFSPNGKLLVMIIDNIIHIWDISTGLESFPLPAERTINDFIFSPGGKLLAYEDSSIPNTVVVNDMTAGNEKFRLVHDGNPYDTKSSLFFSPDGNYLLTRDETAVYLWDMSTGQEKARLESASSFYFEFTFSANSTLVAIKDVNVIRILRTSTGQEISGLLYDSPYYIHPTFSPDGKYLAISADKIVYIWNVSTGQELDHFEYQDFVSTKFLDATADLLAITEGNIIHVRDLASKTENFQIPLRSVAFAIDVNPAGKLLAVADGNAVRLWDIQTGLEEAQILLDSSISILSFDKSGKRLAANDGKNTFLWYLDQGWRGFNLEALDAVSPDGKLLLSSSDCPAKEICPITMQVVDTSTNHEIVNMNISAGPINAVAFSGNHYVAVSDEKFIVRIIDLVTGQVVNQIQSPNFVSSLFFSPDGKLLAIYIYNSTQQDNSIQHNLEIWDVRSGKKIFTLSDDCCNTFQFDLKAQLWVSHGNSISAYDPIHDSFSQIFDTNDQINRLVFSPDGALLAATGRNNTLYVWKISTGQELIQAHLDGPIITLTFDGSGRLLATGSYDKTALLWDVTTGKEVGRLVHDGPVSALDFSSDGNYLATGSDKTARVWDVSTGREVSRMLHNQIVQLVAFDPKETMVISSAETTRLWHWKIDELIGETCKRIPRNFTRAEWRYYFPEEEYKATCPNLPPEPETTPTPTSAPMTDLVGTVSTSTTATLASFLTLTSTSAP